VAFPAFWLLLFLPSGGLGLASRFSFKAKGGYWLFPCG